MLLSSVEIVCEFTQIIIKVSFIIIDKQVPHHTVALDIQTRN